MLVYQGKKLGVDELVVDALGVRHAEQILAHSDFEQLFTRTGQEFPYPGVGPPLLRILGQDRHTIVARIHRIGQDLKIGGILKCLIDHVHILIHLGANARTTGKKIIDHSHFAVKISLGDAVSLLVDEGKRSDGMAGITQYRKILFAIIGAGEDKDVKDGHQYREK